MLDDPLCFNINLFNIKKMTHQHDDKLGNVKQTYGKQAFIWKLGKMMSFAQRGCVVQQSRPVHECSY